jgi:hypothetical protein
MMQKRGVAMKKRVGIGGAVSAVIITNLITVYIMSVIFVPHLKNADFLVNNKFELLRNAVKVLGEKNKNLVTDEEYKFIQDYNKMIYVGDIVNEYYVDKIGQDSI